MILCDIDGVLAFGPSGADTTPDEAIYPTFRRRPVEIKAIRAAGIPFCIVTAKVEVEARQILSALELLHDVDGVVGGDRLFWSTLVLDLSERRIPSVVRKSVSRRWLPDSPGPPVVMIEDRMANLEEMFRRRSIDLGILIPPPKRTRPPFFEWFDLGLALRLAKSAVQGSLDLSSLEEIQEVEGLTRREGRLREAGDNPPLLIKLPYLASEDRPGSPPISPVGVLRASRREMVSWVRMALRWSRRCGLQDGR